MDEEFVKDKDLTFLYNCANEDLKLLTDTLIYDKKEGDTRYTESLTTTDEFKAAYPNNIKDILPAVINELQKFGGNSIMNFFRGHGVCYKEILIDVCKQLKVNFNKDASTELLEKYLLQKLLMISIEKMSDEDVRHLGDVHTKNKDMLIKNIQNFHAEPLALKILTTALLQVCKKQGLKIAGGWVAKFAASRPFAVLSGPVGWGISAIWTLVDVAGPANRVIIPATITIAYLRMKSGLSDDELNQIFN